MVFNLGFKVLRYTELYFSCWVVWIRNVVSHIEGGKQADFFREEGAEKGIWDVRETG